MTDQIRVALLREDGTLDPRAIPLGAGVDLPIVEGGDLIVGGDFGIPTRLARDPEVGLVLTTAESGPGVVGGVKWAVPNTSPAEFVFGMEKTLVVEPGTFYWLSPPWPIKLLRFSVTMGILGTGAGKTTGQLLVNGASVASVDVPASNRVGETTSFSLSEVPGSQLMSIAIAEVASSGAVRPANALLQVLWQYA